MSFGKFGNLWPCYPPKRVQNPINNSNSAVSLTYSIRSACIVRSRWQIFSYFRSSLPTPTPPIIFQPSPAPLVQISFSPQPSATIKIKDSGHNLKILSTRTPKLCLHCRLSTPSHDSRFAALRQRSCGNGSLRHVQRFLRMYAQIFILSLFNIFFALPSDRRFLIWTTSNRSLGYKSRSLSYQQFRFIFGKKNWEQLRHCGPITHTI